MAITHVRLQNQHYVIEHCDDQWRITMPDGAIHVLNPQNISISPCRSYVFFTLAGQPYTCFIVIRTQGPLVLVNPGCQAYDFIDVQQRAPTIRDEVIMPATHVANHDVSDTRYVSPLAGRISKVYVELRQLVKQGQPLMTIESMKMENELCSERTGYIKTIFIKAGDVVQQNQVLVEFEEQGVGYGAKQSEHGATSIQNR